MTTPYSEMLKSSKPRIIITPSPLIMEKPGQSFRGLYLGQQQMTRVVDKATGEVKTNAVAHLYDGEKVYFNMGAQLTRELSRLRVGVSVEITLSELKPNANGKGKTKIYSVAPLDVPIQNIEELFGGFLAVTEPAPEHLLPPAPEQPKAALEVTEPAQTAKIEAAAAIERNARAQGMNQEQAAVYAKSPQATADLLYC